MITHTHTIFSRNEKSRHLPLLILKLLALETPFPAPCTAWDSNQSVTLSSCFSIGFVFLDYLPNQTPWYGFQLLQNNKFPFFLTDLWPLSFVSTWIALKIIQVQPQIYQGKEKLTFHPAARQKCLQSHVCLRYSSSFSFTPLISAVKNLSPVV